MIQVNPNPKIKYLKEIALTIYGVGFLLSLCALSCVEAPPPLLPRNNDDNNTSNPINNTPINNTPGINNPINNINNNPPNNTQTNNNPPNNSNQNNNPPDPIEECVMMARECVNEGNYRLCYRDESGGTVWGPATECKSGVCVGEGKCCEDRCEPGEKICTPDGVHICEQFEDGCTAFSDPVPCPNNDTCNTAGECVASCSSTCTSGELKCFPEGTPAYRECVEVEPGCYQFAPQENQCPTGKLCQQDQCKTQCDHKCGQSELNNTRCDGSNEQKCSQDAQGCRAWQPTGKPCIITGGGTCSSQTLGSDVSPGTCVQVAYESCGVAKCAWAICDDTKWNYCIDPNACDNQKKHPHSACQ